MYASVVLCVMVIVLCQDVDTNVRFSVSRSKKMYAHLENHLVSPHYLKDGKIGLKKKKSSEVGFEKWTETLSKS